MTSDSILILILIVAAFVVLVLSVRKLLRKPPSIKEFRRLFEKAWMAATMMAMGAVWLILRVPVGLNRDLVYLILGVGGLGVALLLLAGYPVSFVAARLYRRWQSEPDFAEDTRDNPVPDRDAPND